jgi:hypothetical protein
MDSYPQEEDHMDRKRRVLRTVVVVVAVGSLATLRAFSAFTSQADNPNNRVSGGTVTLADNDGGTALYDFTGAKPGDSQTSCIRVNYTGSLNADARRVRSRVAFPLGRSARRAIARHVRRAGWCSLTLSIAARSGSSRWTHLTRRVRVTRSGDGRYRAAVH